MTQIVRHSRFLWPLILVGLMLACSDSNDACEKACSKHVSLAIQQAEQKLKWWHHLSEPLHASAKDSERLWRDRFDQRKAEFLDTCTTTCNDGARTSVIECRRRAVSIGEWTRCTRK